MEEHTWCESTYVLLTETFLTRNQSVISSLLPPTDTSLSCQSLFILPSLYLYLSLITVFPLTAVLGSCPPLAPFLFISLLSFHSSPPSFTWSSLCPMVKLTDRRLYKCEPLKIGSTVKPTRKMSYMFHSHIVLILLFF